METDLEGYLEGKLLQSYDDETLNVLSRLRHSWLSIKNARDEDDMELEIVGMPETQFNF